MKSIYHGWWVLLAVTISGLMAYGPGVYAFTLFLKPLGEEFGWGRAVLGGSVSAFWIGAPLIPLIGWWADRHGARLVLVVGALIEGLGYIAIGYVDSATDLYILRVVMGIGKMCIAVPTPILVAEWFDRYKGLAMGIAFGGWHFGGMVAAPPTQLLLDQFGWRTSSMVLGVLIMLVAIPPAALLVRHKRREDQESALFGEKASPIRIPKEAGDGDVGEGAGYTAKEALRMPLFWLIATITVVYYTAYAAILAHQAAFLTDIGFDPLEAASLLGMTAGIAVVGVVGFGILLDRWPYKRLLSLVFAMLAVALSVLIALPYLGESGAGLIYVFVVLFGLAMGAGDVIWVTMLSECFGKRDYGSIFGVWYVFMLSTLALAPIAVGYAYDQNGSYEGAFILVLGVLSIALVTTLVAKLSPFAREVASAEAVSSHGAGDNVEPSS